MRDATNTSNHLPNFCAPSDDASQYTVACDSVVLERLRAAMLPKSRFDVAPNGVQQPAPRAVTESLNSSTNTVNTPTVSSSNANRSSNVDAGAATTSTVASSSLSTSALSAPNLFCSACSQRGHKKSACPTLGKYFLWLFLKCVKRKGERKRCNSVFNVVQYHQRPMSILM